MKLLIGDDEYEAEVEAPVEFLRDAKRQGLTANGRRWLLHNYSEQYAEGEEPHWWTLNLEEWEELNPTRLRIAELELVPTKYQEKVSSSALVITAQVSPTRDEAARIRELDRSHGYFEVVREGISDDPQRMRFGLNLWAEGDSGLEFQLTLVEDSYDHEDDLPPLPMDRNVQSELAVYAVTLDSLLALLVKKGVIAEQQVSQLQTDAVGLRDDFLERFTRVSSLDAYWDRRP